MRHKEINMRTLKTILLFIPYTVYLLFCKIFHKEKKTSWYNNAHEKTDRSWKTPSGDPGSPNAFDAHVADFTARR